METQAAPEKEHTLLACGDILLARTPGKRAEQYGFKYLFEGVRDLVSSVDIAFANLETPVSYLGKAYYGKPENVTFRADPAALFGAAWAGFDVLSVANNHINDYGPRALSETLDYVRLLGMQSCGAGNTLEEARSPAIVEKDGIRFVFLAYAEPIWSAVRARPAPPAVLYGPAFQNSGAPTGQGDPDKAASSTAGIAPASYEYIAEDMRLAKEYLRPDYIFVSIHWGDEHQNIPNAFQISLGRALIDAGATAVLGHHPHVVQSIERYKDGLILYSLGNFVFDMRAESTYRTIAVKLVLSVGRIKRADIIPVRIARGSYAPAPASGGDAASILADVAKHSARYGTNIIHDACTGSIAFSAE